MKLIHRTNEFATHQPILVELVKLLKPDSNILELGCGQGSTELLHLLSTIYDVNVLTLDDNEEWINKYSTDLKNSRHSFLLTSFNSFIDRTKGFTWDLVFIDQGSWDSREECLMYYRDKAKFIVLHDSDYYPGNNRFGKLIKPIVSNEVPGEVDYSDVFKYYKEFYPPLPWPGPSGPPTLVGSNLVDFNIVPDYEVQDLQFI